MSYFKLLGYNVSKKLAGSANSLFSTAVISGSSSAPNLKDMVPPHASAVAAIEGFGGVPPIRPLETLHNALSLRQLDSFLEMMTGVPLFRTPASSPPKFASPVGPGGYHHNLGIDAAARYITPTPIYCSRSGNDGDASEMRSLASPTSPNSTTGWGSEPVSFLSSEPSSPAPTSAGECSMSMSLVSNDGSQPLSGGGAAGGRSYSLSRCLELDVSDFCVGVAPDSLVQAQPQQQPQQQQQSEAGSHASLIRESRGSVSYTDYYSSEDGQIRRSANDNCFPVYVAPGSPAAAPATSCPNDDGDEHTLTLRQSEPLSCATKHDVQSIFVEQSEPGPTHVASSAPRPSSSYKKIGRFRVESMEVADGDARLKESSSLSCSLSSGSRQPPSTAQQQRSQRKATAPGGPGPQLLRSQSVHAPRGGGGPVGPGQPAPLLPKQSSLSAAAPPAEARPEQQPTLTLASSFTDKSRVTFGFEPSPDEAQP